MPEGKPTNNKVEFRLPGEALLQELDRRATEAGRSRGEYSRDLLAAALRDDAQAHLVQRLAECRDDVDSLRDDLRRIAVLLLVNLRAKPGMDQPARDALERDARASVAAVLTRGPQPPARGGGAG